MPLFYSSDSAYRRPQILVGESERGLSPPRFYTYVYQLGWSLGFGENEESKCITETFWLNCWGWRLKDCLAKEVTPLSHPLACCYENLKEIVIGERIGDYWYGPNGGIILHEPNEVLRAQFPRAEQFQHAMKLNRLRERYGKPLISLEPPPLNALGDEKGRLRMPMVDYVLDNCLGISVWRSSESGRYFHFIDRSGIFHARLMETCRRLNAPVVAVKSESEFPLS
jgi:hypothetical protein